MKRWSIIAAVVLFSLIGFAESLRLEYRRTLKIPVTGASAAFALDPEIVEAAAIDGIVTITAKNPGTTHVMVVTSAGVQELVIVVPEPAPAYPEGFVPPPTEQELRQNGSYELRFNSQPSQLYNNITMSRTEGDRTLRMQLGNVNLFDEVGSSTPVSFPTASYSITTPKRELWFLDQTVNASPLTVDGAMVRGFHYREGNWIFHGGVASTASFQHVLLSTEDAVTTGLGYRWRINTDSTLTPSVYYFYSPEGNVLSSPNGAVGSLYYQYARPNGPLTLSAELGISKSVAASVDAKLTNAGNNWTGHLQVRPDRFPGLSQGGLFGTQTGGGWDREFSERLSASARVQYDHYSFGAISQTNFDAGGTIRTRFSRNWSLAFSPTLGQFTTQSGSEHRIRTTSTPVTLNFDTRRFGTSFGYGLVTNSDSSKLGSMLHIGGRTGFGRWSFNGFYDRQTEAVTLALLISSTPGLQDLLDRLGIGATSVDQITALLRDQAILTQLGLPDTFSLQLSPVRTFVGGNATYLASGKSLQRIDLSLLVDTHDSVNAPSYRSIIGTATYSRKLTSHDDLLFSWSHFRGGSLDNEISHNTVQFSIRHQFTSVPNLLLPRRTGTISGFLFLDDELKMARTPNSQPIVGVTVILDGEQRTETDARGFYRFRDVPYGPHSLEVLYKSDQPYYLTTASQKQVEINTRNDFGIAFAVANIFGSVRNDADYPIPGVTMRARSEKQTLELAADSSGNFRIQVPGAQATAFKIMLDPESFPPGYDIETLEARDIAVSPTQPAHADFVIRALRSISGTVTSYHGQQSTNPLAGVVVEDTSSGAKSKTDAQGRFVFRDLRAGLHVLRVTYEGMTQEQAIELGPNPETHRDVDLQFKITN